MWTSFRHLSARIRAVFSSHSLDSDFDQELELHLALLAEDCIRSGMLPEDARRAARLKLGGCTQLREAHRAARGLPLLDILRQDIQFALRTLCKSPGYTAIAVLTLTAGIGLNTAVFTVYDAAAMRPLEASDPARVVQITRTPRTQDRFFSYPDYVWYRDRNSSFSGLIATSTGESFTLGGFARPAQVQSPLADAVGIRFPQILGRRSEEVVSFGVTGNYFQVLGVAAAMGRTILPEDDTPTAPPVALVSFRFWDQRLARDPHPLGRVLNLSGHDMTVVGVAPADFSGTLQKPPDVWLPLMLQARLASDADVLHAADIPFCSLYGRLRSGITRAGAEAEVNTLATRLRPRTADSPRRRTRLLLAPALPGGPPAANDWAVPFVVLAPVGLVLLIACANLAGLLLARSAARQREIAIRVAIGASRGRLIRQLLTENAVVSLCAAIGGVALSSWLVHFLTAQIASSMPNAGLVPIHAIPDARVLAFSLFLALATTVGCGLAPALEASRPNLTASLKDESAGGSLGKSRLRDLLVGTQVAVCLLLLIAAGMLTRVSQKVLAVDLGFDYRHIVYLRANFPASGGGAGVAALRMQLTRQLSALAEVQSVAAARGLPLAGGFGRASVNPGGGSPDSSAASNAMVNLVSPDYFATMGIPILRGRNFGDQESRVGFNFDGSPVIVSESAARRFWPGQDAIGKTVTVAAPRNSRQFASRGADPHTLSSPVIGVARDVRSVDLHWDGDTCVLYFPETAAALGTTVLRTRGEVGRAEAAIHRELQATHSDLEAEMGDSTTAFTTQGEFSAARAAGIGSAILGILGLLMASLGIYGTVAFAVTRRTQEIGIRMALGAQRRSVLRLVLWETMRPVGLGLAVGFAAAAGISRVMQSFLFGLSALDPTAFLGVTSFLAAIALFAGYLPARRAAKVDPLLALRYE